MSEAQVSRFGGNRVKESLARGEPVIGTFVKLTDPSVVEIIGYLGYDFFVMDTEHGTINPESRANLLRAADAASIVSLIRVREKSAPEILQALDAGAGGVLVPQVATAEEVRSIVQASRYAPDGMRGFATVIRSARYGIIPAARYLPAANAATLVVCYCETYDFVRNLDEILTIDGIDVIFLGPMDLSQSMGLPGEIDHPRVKATLDDVKVRVLKAGKTIGTIASDGDHASRLVEEGFRFLTISSDQSMLVAAARAPLERYRSLSANRGKT